MPELHDLSPSPGSHRDKKRVGRGPGSGTGKTSGRGENGQGARSGGGVPSWFEGGQMPLQRRLPKRGFKNFNRVEYQGVNVRDLSRIGPGEVTPEILRQNGLIRSLKKPVKILGTGEIDGAYQVSAHAFSGAARSKIEKAGGTVTVLGAQATAGEKGVETVEEVTADAGEVEVVAEAVTESEEASAPEGSEAPEAEDEEA